MAEPVSSIITIATVTLTAIRDCINYIESLRSVDKSVERLIDQINGLERIVYVIQKTYRKAGPEENDSTSLLVRERLQQCRDRLDVIRPKAEALGIRESETLMDRTILKRKYDEVAKEFELTTKDIKNYTEEINQVFNCWGLEALRYIRRISEASQSLSADSQLESTQPSPPSPPSLALSEAENDREDDFLAQAFADSIEKSDLSFSMSPPSTTLANDTTSASDHDDDWEDFHDTVSKCRDDTSDIEKVRTLLQQARDHVALANVAGHCQRVPLHVAAQHGHGQVARVLLDYGAEVNAKDSRQFSALDHAVANKQRAFVAILLENGADETAIHDANQTEFKNIKSVINFENKRRDSVTKEEPLKKSRKLSLMGRRKPLT